MIPILKVNICLMNYFIKNKIFGDDINGRITNN